MDACMCTDARTATGKAPWAEGRAPASPMQAVERSEGNGSGVVWDRDGHIVTNWHVLRGVFSSGLKILPGAKVARVFILGERCQRACA
jgi:S1-C subfamily serine protease